ncbi:MAG: SIS domain-containing protein [Lachnospiraceae bacterium]|nr:SIS domain-containing protein [Lachnospiraceae bacterium]
MERRGVAAIALNANAAVMTAISNDYDYENIFSRQVAALGRAGDVLFGISTSGNSANVEKALQEAKKRGIHTVGLTGRRGGKLQAHTEYLLNVPSDSTPRIQEMHILLIHTLCGLIENGLCEQGFWTEERD